MALSVRIEDSDQRLHLAEFDSQNNEFVCRTGDRKESVVRITYPLDVPDRPDPEEYSIHLLESPSLREEDIRQVYDRDANTRIGWLFPVQALASSEHSHIENTHFLRYALVAAHLLLAGSEPHPCRSPDVTLNPDVSFADFFDSQVAVLVISIETVGDQKPLLGRWIPALAAYGFSPLSDRSAAPLVTRKTLMADVRINLRTLPDSTPGLSFVDRIFGELVPREPSPQFRLFYLYQVVELLLDVVYQREQKKLLGELQAAIEEPLKAKDVLDRVSDVAKEKKRLKILHEEYLSGNGPVSTSDLREACNRFLQGFNYNTVSDAYESLYLVRNIVFHRYRDVTDSSNIEEIADELLIVLPDALYSLASRIASEAT